MSLYNASSPTVFTLKPSQLSRCIELCLRHVLLAKMTCTWCYHYLIPCLPLLNSEAEYSDQYMSPPHQRYFDCKVSSHLIYLLGSHKHSASIQYHMVVSETDGGVEVTKRIKKVHLGSPEYWAMSPVTITSVAHHLWKFIYPSSVTSRPQFTPLLLMNSASTLRMSLLLSCVAFFTVL
jgi:hypothetical protein